MNSFDENLSEQIKNKYDTDKRVVCDDIIEWIYNKPQIKVTFNKHLNDNGIEVLSIEMGVIVKYDSELVIVDKHFEYIPSNEKLLSTLKRMYSSVWC